MTFQRQHRIISLDYIIVILQNIFMLDRHRAPTKGKMGRRETTLILGKGLKLIHGEHEASENLELLLTGVESKGKESGWNASGDPSPFFILSPLPRFLAHQIKAGAPLTNIA